MASKKQDVKALAMAIHRLEALCSEDENGKGRHCGVGVEHKRAVRLYVETWVLPLLTSVREDLLPDEVRTPFSESIGRHMM